MVVIGKVFQEGFLFVIKNFLMNKEELQPDIDLLIINYLKTFLKSSCSIDFMKFLKVVTFYGLNNIYEKACYQWVICPQ
jgi:hypothetical protein